MKEGYERMCGRFKEGRECKKKVHLARDSQAHFWVQNFPRCGYNELLLCFALWRRRRHGEAGMADHAGTMPPFHCCPLCTDLCIVPSTLPPSIAPFRHSHPRPAGTEMAAPLTRFTIPPLVHATIAGHGHRHLYGTQEAEEGMLGPHRQVVLPTSR